MLDKIKAYIKHIKKIPDIELEIEKLKYELNVAKSLIENYYTKSEITDMNFCILKGVHQSIKAENKLIENKIKKIKLDIKRTKDLKENMINNRIEINKQFDILNKKLSCLSKENSKKVFEIKVSINKLKESFTNNEKMIIEYDESVNKRIDVIFNKLRRNYEIKQNVKLE